MIYDFCLMKSFLTKLRKMKNQMEKFLERGQFLYVQRQIKKNIVDYIQKKKLIDFLNKSLDFLTNENNVGPLVKIAVFHYLFGYAHPFYNGNGRTSRFISSYLLCNILNQSIALRISYTIKNDKNKYYKAF